MKSLRRATDVVLDRVSDVIGTTIATVVVFVLFAQEYRFELQDHQPELYLLLGTLILVNLLTPLISHKARIRRIYVLSFSHIVWIALLLLSGADSAFVISINMGLIVLTSLWLDAASTFLSTVMLSLALAAVTDSPIDEAIFVVGTQGLLGLYLAHRHVHRKSRSKAAQSKLSEALIERERLQSLINSMADGVVATDENGRVVLYNGAALDILNINATLENMHLSDFMKLRDSADKPVDIFAKVQKAKAYFVSRDYRLRVDKDEYMNVFTSIAPVRIGYGKRGERGYIMLIRDITREKSLEEERDEFISVVSHELRTPVTITEGNISNLKLLAEKQKKIDGKMQEAINDAHEQVVFLADMINDLSTLSRAERGVLHVEPETIDPVELVRNLVHEYEIEAKQKGLKLSFTGGNAGAAHIVTSRLYVREILQNFINNAIKYTEKGSINVKLEAVDDKSVRVRVKDTGIGISKNDQKQLFKKFFRSEDYRTRKNSGTGLGLYVTLKLAKLIKADVEVKSRLNEGSEFSITIPTLKKRHAHV